MSAPHLQLILGLADEPLTTEEAWATVVSVNQRHALEMLDRLTAAGATYDNPADAAEELETWRIHAIGVLNVIFDSVADRVRRGGHQ